MSAKKAAQTIDLLDKGLYRRQFLLAPHPLEFPFPSWDGLNLGDTRSHVYIHPDLSYAQVQVDGRQATALGYILDPDWIGAPEEELLRNLLKTTRSLDQVFAAVERWSGRWILILDDGHDTFLFHDAFGARQVHHYWTKAGCWAATQPHLLEEVLPLECDPVATEYRESRLAQSSRPLREYAWPGEASEYVGVKRLLPNHFLDLRTGNVTRFWPREVLEPAQSESVAESVADLFRRLFQAARARFNLAVTMTAGMDTRLLLAGTRDFSDEIYYHTCAYWGLGARDPDLSVPRTLLRTLGLSHHVLPCPTDMSPAFNSLYQRHVAGAHPDWGVIAEGMQRHYPDGWLCVKGNGGEVSRPGGREKPGLDLDDIESSVEQICVRNFLPSSHPLVREHVSEWRRKALPACRTSGVRIAELCYWELRMGSWQAMGQAEWDLVQEVFTPFNCRFLHAQLYRLPLRDRMNSEAWVSRLLFQHLWPEVLCVPINPVPLRTRLTAFFNTEVRPLLRASGLGHARNAVRALLSSTSDS